MKRFFPYDVFGRLASLNDKMAEKEKNTADSGTSGRFAGALYHDNTPRAFGPRFAYASWSSRWFRAAFRNLVPDKAVNEG